MTLGKETIEVKTNSLPFDLRDLSRVFYFHDSDDLPIITEHPELKEGERLRVLIPEEIVTARIEALAKEIEAMVAPNPEDYIFGAILEGGRFLHDKVRALLPGSVDSQIPTFHSEIKSRYATRTGKYEVKLLPPAEIVNGRICLVFEGVADSTETLRLLEENLTKPPYKSVDLRVALLIDKIEAHTEIPLPNCVYWCLFAMDNKWMVGCGTDTDGRFRNLPFIAIYEKITELQKINCY